MAGVKPNHRASPGPIANTGGMITPETSPHASGPGNAAPAPQPTKAEQGWWSRWGSGAVHLGLDIVGMIPVVGEVADGANALIYLAEGDKVNAALSAAAMLPTGGQAATAAKWGNKGLQSAVRQAEKKAAKELEEVAAKNAQKKAATEGEQAGQKSLQQPEKSQAKSGGHVMGPKKICFKSGNKTKDKNKEFDRQLAEQEKALNNMTVQDYLDGRGKFLESGRYGTGAAQQAARQAHMQELTRGFERQLARQGVVGQAAQDQATKMAADKMGSLAALHNPDMIAGGKDVVTGMGDRGVNSSIGSQWRSKVGELDQAAKSVPESERGKTKMNVKLERCP